MAEAENRNLVSPETAERNRTEGEGGYTFNALPPDAYTGPLFVAAVIRLGDHAHIEISTGHHVSQPSSSGPALRYGVAGKLVMPWSVWLELRATLGADERWRIAEVERPTKGQLERYVSPPVPVTRDDIERLGSIAGLINHTIGHPDGERDVRYLRDLAKRLAHEVPE